MNTLFQVLLPVLVSFSSHGTVPAPIGPGSCCACDPCPPDCCGDSGPTCCAR